MNPELLKMKEELDRLTKAASDTWRDFSKAKTEAETKGVNLLTDDAAFNAVQEKSKAYHEASAAAERKRAEYLGALEASSEGKALGGQGDTGSTKAALTGAWPDALSKSFIENADKAGLGGVKAFDVTAGGTATSQFYDPALRLLPQRRLFVRSLIPVKAGMDTDKFDYLRQTVATHNAAETAAGALKPTSVYSFERVEDRVRTIAHLSEPADRAMLLDLDSLEAFIDGQLRLGVLLREDSQIVNGSGTGENLRGILNTVGILTLARGADPHVDAVLKGIITLRAQANPVEPNAVVMNPNDVQEVLLTKDAGGDYQAGESEAFSVDADGNLRLWGKEVIQSIAIAAGTSVVGDFNQCRIYDREQARVDWASSGGLGAAAVEIFSRNQLVARGEERIGFAVERPTAFLSLTGM